MYKLTRPDGFDFYSDTINYRDAIGAIVRVTDYDPASVGAYGKGLHASSNPNDCLVGAKIPCAAFRVEGIQKIAGNKKKSRYQALRVIEEIEDLNTLFGWNYAEAVNPLNPFAIDPPIITDEHITLVNDWHSVGKSVEHSVRESVVWESVRESIWGSLGELVGGSLVESVRKSIWDSVGAYIGSLFPNIEVWKHVEHLPECYPYQSVVDLWRQGLVPSYDGKIWRLHGGPKGSILWEGGTDK